MSYVTNHHSTSMESEQHSFRMILVTGATGNVGRELVPQLLQAGQDVRVLVRDPKRAATLDGRAGRAAGDRHKRETLFPAMNAVHAIYLIAFETSQVENVIAAAKAAGVKHIVRQSTIEAGPVHPFGPGKWHREQELLIERSGIAWTHLRPTLMMMNTIRWWADSIRDHGTVLFPGGDGRLSPVDPRDVAAVGRAVLTQPGHETRSYEVTGPEVVTIGKMVEALSRVLGRRIRYIDVPEKAAAEWMAQRGASSVLAAALVETLAALRSSQDAYVADSVERLTGEKGRTFEAWCHENVGAFE